MNLSSIIAARLRCHTDALLREAEDGSCPQDRFEWVSRALGVTSDPRARTRLRCVLSDPNVPRTVRQRASDTLRRFDLTDGLDEVVVRGWWESGDELLRVHALAVAPQRLRDQVMDLAARPSAALHRDAIAGMRFEFGWPAARRLKLRAARHPDSEVRFVAAEGIVMDESVGGLEALCQLCGDESPAVAKLAIDGLRHFPSRRAIDTVLEVVGAEAVMARQQLREDLDCALEIDGVGTAVRQWLGEDRLERLERVSRGAEPPSYGTTCAPAPESFTMHERPAVPVEAPPSHVVSAQKALDLLSDADASVTVLNTLFREVAWECTGPALRRELIQLLRGHSDVVRRHGLVALAARWQDLDLLLAHLDDPEVMVQRASLFELAKLDPTDVIGCRVERYLDKPGPSNDVAASEALELYRRCLGNDAVGLLSEWAADESRSPAVRIAALRALAKQPLGSGHLPFLAEMIFGEQPSSWTLSTTLVHEAAYLGFLSKRSVAHLRGVDDLNLVVALARFDAARN